MLEPSVMVVGSVMMVVGAVKIQNSTASNANGTISSVNNKNEELPSAPMCSAYVAALMPTRDSAVVGVLVELRPSEVCHGQLLYFECKRKL